MTSIDDVARAAGVSTSTVSRALRGLPNVSEGTRATIKEAASKLGYVPSSSASGLASGRTLALGVVVPSVSRWFYTKVLEGIDSELRLANYDTVLFNLGAHLGDRERVFHRSLLRKRTDALIALCIDFTDDEKQELKSTGHPVMIVGGPVSGLRHVGIDERGVARTATRHLLSLGHRDIALLGGEDEAGLNRRVPANRRAGYLEALAAEGIHPRPDREYVGAFSIATSRAVMRTALADPGDRPTAIFAESDEMAIGAMLAAGELGLTVPGDLSVIGIDDHDLAEGFGLTTMRQDPFAQGALATRMLLTELETGTPVRRRSVILPVTLIARATTAPPRAS